MVLGLKCRAFCLLAGTLPLEPCSHPTKKELIVIKCRVKETTNKKGEEKSKKNKEI
jgi:hypothetical protein